MKYEEVSGNRALETGNGPVRKDSELVEDKAGHGCASMEEVVGPQGRGIPQKIRDVCQTLAL